MTDNHSGSIRSIALVAHDNCKPVLADWVVSHRERLADCTLYATGTTGRLLAERSGLEVERLLSGPLGGDQQIGALIVEQKLDMLVFFWDPLEPMSHDPDVKALLRIATLWNIPVACNRMTADFLLRSDLFDQYEPQAPDFSGYLNRTLP